MAVDKEHLYDTGIYFITFTNYNWLQLFSITQSYDLVYKWFDVLKSKGHSVLRYVIMPNHLHALIGFTQTTQSINTIIGNGKRFIAYDILARLKETNNTQLLQVLSEGVAPADRRKGQLHVVYQGDPDIKLCHTYKFIQQKLDYIHSNPVSKKWSLVKEPVEYEHSSARYYLTGVQGIYNVADAGDWVNEHLFDQYSNGKI